jgi:hypothetical protein
VGRSWRFSSGPHDTLYLHEAEDGGIRVVTEEDPDEGLIIRFTPHYPILLPDLSPGTTRSFNLDIDLYDLSDPDDREHRGHLKLHHSYLGAFEVKVPAGTYRASLIRWEDTGSVGPADFEDRYYRFFAKDVGIVALVDKKNLTAFWLYEERSKEGEVLTEVCPR